MKLTHRLHKLKCELTTKVWKTLIIIDLYIVHDLHATPSVHWTYNSLSYNGAPRTDVSPVHEVKTDFFFTLFQMYYAFSQINFCINHGLILGILAKHPDFPGLRPFFFFLSPSPSFLLGSQFSCVSPDFHTVSPLLVMIICALCVVYLNIHLVLLTEWETLRQKEKRKKYSSKL